MQKKKGCTACRGAVLRKGEVARAASWCTPFMMSDYREWHLANKCGMIKGSWNYEGSAAGMEDTIVSNRICDLLGCQYPIVEGGLAYVGNGLLAAAVSNAGAFGQVGCGGRSASDFVSQVEIALNHTNQPFGVNVPLGEHHDVTPYMAVIRNNASRLRAVSLSAGNPRPWIKPLHDLGLVVMTLASTPVQAQKAEAAGADIIICEGTEAGGHNGPSGITTIALVPAATDLVAVPVIAAGGIADGRAAAAAFCLGAEGVQMGTRFVATIECQAHANYKEALVAAHTEDTAIIEHSFGRITRVLKSPVVDAILEQETKTPGDRDKIGPMLAGRVNALAAIEGNVTEGWMYCGQGVGLVHSFPAAREVVQNIVESVRGCLGKTYGWL